METAALIAFIALVAADGVTTEIGMRRGKVEGGALAAKIFGRKMQTWGNVVFQAAKVAAALAFYWYAPQPLHLPVLGAVVVATAYVVIQNIRVLR